MAHTDACKIQVCKFMERLVDNGMSLRNASLATQKESDGIPAKTIQRWWADIKKETEAECLKNETPTTTTGNNEEKQEKPSRDEGGRFQEGAPPGPGRKPKNQATPSYQEVTEALDFAIIAISQLERIRADDPKRFEAFDKVISWIETRKEDMQNGR